MNELTALVLAGTRPGGDPLAAYAGVSHKALIRIGGRAMIERVVGALSAVPRVRRIVVATERPDLLDALAGLWPPVCRLRIECLAAREGPSATVEAALRDLGTPLLVTTADHALLQAQWIEDFLAACPAEADVAAALAPRAAVEAAVPHTRRTYLRFADGDYSGCNLFLLARPAASAVVALWRELESERKRPLRMMRHLGLGYALRYRLGRLSSQAASQRLGLLAGGARLALVKLAQGLAAVDVDKPEDLELVRRLVGTS
ncbi:MAG: NTP transferase domain-containing protein [Pseudomonadota bacterium]